MIGADLALQTLTSQLQSAADRTGVSAGVELVDKNNAGFNGLKAEDFVKILLAELQNQNPLEPTDNSKILEQVTQINSLTSSQKLTDTLNGFALSQGLSSASSLIGKSVTGQVGDATISGTVSKAVVESGQVFLMVGEKKLPLSSVNEIS